jgi:DNA-binding CsgD family transcriptional regulator
MYRRAVLTPEQIAAAVEAVEAGETPTAIAERYGVTPSAIDSHCRKAGVVRFGGKYLRQPPAEPRSYVRNGKVVRLFTAAEDEELRRLEAQGLSAAEIGRRLGRNPNTVSARLTTLGLHEEVKESA